ncbi:Alkaline-phosphatase-like, core domain protein [Acididesulfobacillus acetoxydans]|uniref:Alkaline-phosphatase-like, core domain protein n=1 Tax=Acididesulfobacillus acetoxydans TaxID=1561005 RepID=A0A8S0WLE2_9FIRM|nr:alkaline phosphatase family protein [Acididesulfobacillus acetoxydans]CAA7599964.1 Alkaline-phosphatase-like, core domain protein [Acididesulfobacillus acetoxydans]CEJ07944.1 Metalloenzyme domain protein [Acididesulfobacillus acetoxydans]
MRFLMIFVDGFGLGGVKGNPVYSARTPVLDKLLGGHLLWGERRLRQGPVGLVPLDACLGVSGLPQSATGQTTLWTGVNAAQALGRHLNAYPNKALTGIIERNSIFRQLAERGKKVMFANAFTDEFEKLVQTGKKRLTASTLCALAGGVVLRRISDLYAGRAVYQEMTNALLRERGLDVPLISPYSAGQNLGKLMLDYDFTLYEFFRTDRIGHKQFWQESIETVEEIDGLLGGLMSVVAGEEAAWLLTSDHGNIEDVSVKGHTLNPVPALAWSNPALRWPEWSTLAEVTPGIVRIVCGDKG